MSVLPRRTITKETPIKKEEIKEFKDSLEIGDTLTARLPFKKYTSTTNFSIAYKSFTVTITKKYPFIVGTDHGNFTWNELVLGYHGYTPSDEGSIEIPAVKKSRASKKKAA